MPCIRVGSKTSLSWFILLYSMVSVLHFMNQGAVMMVELCDDEFSEMFGGEEPN